MKALKLLFVLGLLFGAYELVSTGLEQFEHFLEVKEVSYHSYQLLPTLHVTGLEYNTPFHVVNMAALVLLAVVAVVAAIYVANEEPPSSLGNYIRIVLLATAGIVGLATSFAEFHLNQEFSNYGLAHPFHEGSAIVLLLVSFMLIAFALVYLFADLDLDGEYEPATPEVDSEPKEEPNTAPTQATCGHHCCAPAPYGILIVDLSSLEEEAEDDLPDFEAEVKGTYVTEDGDLKFEATFAGNYPQAQSFDDELAEALLNFFLSGGRGGLF